MKNRQCGVLSRTKDGLVRIMRIYCSIQHQIKYAFVFDFGSRANKADTNTFMSITAYNLTGIPCLINNGVDLIRT